jgi:hypothetical protein
MILINVIKAVKNKFLDFLYYARAEILTILGDIKYFRFPFFIVYDPNSFKIKGHQYYSIAKHIKEGDVLLRRYDSYIDRFFIPGWWNHAGIYKGGENYEVVHAIAEGVKIETLFDFCKTDHIILLRPKFKVDYIEFSKKIVSLMERNTQYDFAFNFEDPTNLSCTEVIYYFYKNHDSGIELSTVLGKKVLPPDNIIKGNFEKILEYKN